MSKKQEIFENVLTENYKHDSFVGFAKEFLTGCQLVAPNKYNKEYSNFSHYVNGYYHIANVTTPDKEKLAVLSVCLNKGNTVERARSMQRNFVKTLMERGGIQASIVAFYTANDVKKPELGDAKWRLSFIRMDYEFSAGKVSEKLTPAKRYSYLVGDKEPCNTAKQRLYPIVSNDDKLPTLDELEEAFSVERVTKEFFDLYSEKYHQLRERLEANDDFMKEADIRGFTSEQFAKKLMGQIVFLYFIQKKGWLGVGVWPRILTEKEYNNVFYTKGAVGKVIKEYLPSLYKQRGEEYVLVGVTALDSLPDDAERAIADNMVGQKKWGDGDKQFVRTLFKYAQSNNKNFFDDFLEPLFYDTLNRNRGDKAYSPFLHCRIPFLNGGLFEELDGYDWRNNDFNIPNDIFSHTDEKGEREADGILDIFDRYNFTMNEDEPMEREVAVDPEMLGKVFENLLDVKDRKSKGAFYTPREIVHYMCQESLINHLTTKTGISEKGIRDLIIYGDLMKDEDTLKTKWVHDDKTGANRTEYDYEKDLIISDEILSFKNGVNRLQELDDILGNVKVADLAVGSGAFPMGMVNEIVKVREVLSEYMSIGMNSFEKRSFMSFERQPYSIKVNTIKNCIFACDIEASAVDIAKLRLWLSIVIDDQIDESEGAGTFNENTKPRQLPNLDCNIICGNSLIDEFMGTKLITDSTILGNEAANKQYTMYQGGVDSLITEIIKLQDKLYFEKDKDEKEALKRNIQSLYDRVVLHQIGGMPELVEEYQKAINMPSKPFILWQLYFPKVFRDNGGFDIVIGNPPYVDSEEMTKSMPELREIYYKSFDTAKGNWDLFVLFIEKAIKMLANEGVNTLIVPNKLISAGYAKAVREYMAHNKIVEIRDYSNVNVFKSAAVYPVVFRLLSSEDREDVSMCVMEDMLTVKNENIISRDKFYSDTDWDKYFSSSLEILELLEKIKNNIVLGDIASVNGAATVNEAYLVKDFLLDGVLCEDEVKFVNTGGLDRYKSLYGIEPIRYLKGKYSSPKVKLSNLKEMSKKRYNESLNEKIIIGGMNKVLECIYDNGEYLAGKSTTIVYNTDNMKYILALLNSKLMSFYYHMEYNSMSLAGGFYRTGAPQIKTLPIAKADDEIINELEQLVDRIQLLYVAGNRNEIIDCENMIDQLVFKAYGLTETEISIVNSHFEED